MTRTLTLYHEDLGLGSRFESGLRLNFDNHTFEEWAAYTCNCSEEAMMERWAVEGYEDHWEDPEETERLLLHDQLVDEYLWEYARDPNISGLTFTEWAEQFAPQPLTEDQDHDETILTSPNYDEDLGNL